MWASSVFGNVSNFHFNVNFYTNGRPNAFQWVLSASFVFVCPLTLGLYI